MLLIRPSFSTPPPSYQVQYEAQDAELRAQIAELQRLLDLPSTSLTAVRVISLQMQTLETYEVL